VKVCVTAAAALNLHEICATSSWRVSPPVVAEELEATSMRLSIIRETSVTEIACVISELLPALVSKKSKGSNKKSRKLRRFAAAMTA